MSGKQDDFANAPIRFDFVTSGPDERSRIDIFTITGVKGQFLFEVDYKFISPTDFRVVISNFGLRNKYNAGARAQMYQHQFDVYQIDSAKRRILEFFFGNGRKALRAFYLRQGASCGR